MEGIRQGGFIGHLLTGRVGGSEITNSLNGVAAAGIRILKHLRRSDLSMKSSLHTCTTLPRISETWSRFTADPSSTLRPHL